MGHIKEVNICVKTCPKCKRAFYPEFYQNGLIFVHNKFVLTIEAILDILNSLKNGSSLIETIKDKLLLLGQLAGIPNDLIEKDITNNSIKLEKVVIAVANILVTGEDLDDVTCYLCGNCPKIVSTDGNAKDTIKAELETIVNNMRIVQATILGNHFNLEESVEVD